MGSRLLRGGSKRALEKQTREPGDDSTQRHEGTPISSCHGQKGLKSSNIHSGEISGDSCPRKALHVDEGEILNSPGNDDPRGVYHAQASDLERSPGKRRLEGEPGSVARQPVRRKSRRLSGLGPQIIPVIAPSRSEADRGRTSAPNGNVGNGQNQCHSLFSEVFESAKVMTLEVEQCIVLEEFSTRPMVRFGVDRFKNVFLGGSHGHVSGHINCGDMPIVTLLPKAYEKLSLRFFLELGREKDLSQAWINSNPMYLVVNGRHRHRAWWLCNDEKGYKFGGFKWHVLVIPWQEAPVLKSIARMANELQKKEHVIDFTFCDEMVNLREVIDQHSARNGVLVDTKKPIRRAFVDEIVAEYSGSAGYSNSTLSNLVRIAAKLSTPVVQFMKSKIDEEVEEIAYEKAKGKMVKAEGVFIDYRAFKKILNSQSFRGSKIFMSISNSDEDRMNAILRLRYISQNSGKFSGMSRAAVDEQAEKAIRARLEVEKFKRVLDSNKVPDEMQVPLQNLVQTTVDDAEVEKNLPNTNTILKSVRDTFLSVCGKYAGTLLERYEKRIRDSQRTANPGSSTETVSADAKNGNRSLQEVPQEMNEQITSEANEAEEVEENVEEVHPATAEVGTCYKDVSTEHDNEMVEKDLEKPTPLERCRVEVLSMGWEAYQRHQVIEHGIFDLVITEPFQRNSANSMTYMDEDEVTAFAKFVRRVLTPGSYCFIVLDLELFTQWRKIFNSLQMNTLPPYYLIKSPRYIAKTKGSNYQNPVEVGMIAQKPGRHPKEFEKDLLSPYSHLQGNSFPRFVGAIDNIEPPKRRLFYKNTRSPVRISEKSSSVYWELLKTFCPPGGRVLDPYAGVLTTGIACVESFRPCTLLETDDKCLDAALDRLKLYAENSVQKGVTDLIDLENNTAPAGIEEDNGELELIGANVNCHANPKNTSSEEVMSNSAEQIKSPRSQGENTTAEKKVSNEEVLCTNVGPPRRSKRRPVPKNRS